ncbi:membrane protein containing Diguanylate phosphodiesterase, predicted domain protein, partial [mine drainage metagenome]
MAFAQRSGCALIAEGVETPAELEALRALGVPLVQGFLLGPPAALPATAGAGVFPPAGSPNGHRGAGMMDASAAPGVASAPRPSLLHRVRRGAGWLAWRSRAFWVTQLLVLVTMSVHFAFSYLYRHGPVAIPPFVTIPLELVPIAYAAVRFGLRGSLPTALWIGVLLLPRFIFLDS